tara:strand:- start:923 stop:1294 length:372 start_codon:yes stop_codon:yes gene_type:complete
MSLAIDVKGIKAYGKHGVYREEKEKEQLFIIDVKLLINQNKEPTNNIDRDNLNKTINYEKVIETVINLVKQESFSLIETIAFSIIDKLRDEKINEISVTVHKPDTKLSKLTDDISVTVSEKFK